MPIRLASTCGALLDLAFVVGGVLAVVVAPLCVAVVRSRRSPRGLAPAVTMTGVVTIAVLVLWLNAFDEVAPGETVPNELFPVTTVLMAASATGCLVLVACTAGTLVRCGGAPASRPHQ